MTKLVTKPAPTFQAAEIRLFGVSKKYGAVTALKPLDLVIAPGSLVTLLGPSGCGKTTLLRLIAGLETASSGTITIGNRDVTHLTARDRSVSMVFQSYALFPHMTVRENVLYGLQSSGIPRAEALAQAERTLAMVGLASLGDRAPSELSGGQQQRVALSRALVLKPDVLLFDEPLSNLDTRLRRQMRQEIRSLQQSLGITVVYVTHDQSEAMAVSDTIIVMRNAEITEAGSPEQLYRKPAHEFVAAFMGEANIVPVTVERATEAMAAVRLGDTRFELPINRPVPHTPKLVLRPEALALLAAGTTTTQPTLPGVVKQSTYTGPNWEYVIETAVGTLLVLGPPQQTPHHIGDPVAVCIDPQSAVLVAST